MKHNNLHIHIALAEQESKEWIDSFCNLLRLSVEQLQGAAPKFFVHGKALTMPALEAHEALIVVISPFMGQQQALIKSIAHLQERMEESKSEPRIFKLVKIPIEQHLLPQGLKTLLAYNFYEIDHVSGTIMSLSRLGNSDMPHALWANLVDLTYDILESLHGDTVMMNMGRGHAVYLAETGTDLQLQRRLIKRELSRYGYKVLPTAILPENIAELTVNINTDLEQALFSVHLIGETRGDLVVGADQSVAELQHKMVLSHTTSHQDQEMPFREFIWIPPYLRITNERQQIFVDQLMETADSQRGIELIQMQLEDFKIIILRQLTYQIRKALGQQDDSKEAMRGQKPSVYLIADGRDIEASEPLAKWLSAQGVEVFWLGQDKQATERGRHIDYLNRCDACIIFFQRASREWLITKMQDILKSPGLGRRKQKGAAAIFVQQNTQKDIAEELKRLFSQYSDINIIHQRQEIPETALKKVIPTSVLPV